MMSIERWAKSIKDFVVRAKIPNNYQPGTSNRCNRSNCEVDDILDESNTFTDADGGRVYGLRKGDLHCNSDHVVYKLRCRTCGLQYTIGSTITKFRKRINNYKSQFRNYSDKKRRGVKNPGEKISQASLMEHFCAPDHHGMDDWSFQLIDWAENLPRLRERESFWQYRLQSFIPQGLNEREVPT